MSLAISSLFQTIAANVSDSLSRRTICSGFGGFVVPQGASYQVRGTPLKAAGGL